MKFLNTRLYVNKVTALFYILRKGEVDRIEIPGNEVSGITFGGPNLDKLIVTTEKIGFDIMRGGFETESDAASSDGSGYVYVVGDLDTSGLPGRKICV